MRHLLSELPASFRSLRRRPGFAVLAVVTLASGIAVATSVFTALEAVLLRALPYAQPQGLVIPGESSDIPAANNIGYVTFLDWQSRVRSFESIAVWRTRPLAISGSGPAQQLSALQASADFFRVFDVRPQLGRLWTSAEDRQGKHRVAVLSDAFWRSRFGADPAIIGKPVVLNEASFEVIGVLPPGFRALFAEAALGPIDVYSPLAYDAAFRDACRNCRHLRAIARLRDPAQFDRAAEELSALHAELKRSHPEDYPLNRHTVLIPLKEQLTRGIDKPLLLLSGAAGLVLLIACFNVANLLLMRTSHRWREMQIRAALGATPGRLFSQGLAESTSLAFAGGVAGVGLSAWLTPALIRLAPAGIAGIENAGFNWRVLLFAFAAAAISGLLAGITPALAAVRESFEQRSSRGSESKEQRGARDLLVIAELGLAFGLLLVCGLLLKSFVRLNGVQPGFQTQGVLTAELNTVSPRYPKAEDDVRFFEQITQEIGQRRGIRGAAATSVLPLSGNFDMTSFALQGQTYARSADQPVTDRFVVTPGYLELMNIPILRGRGFTQADRATAPPVVIINAAAAAKFFGARDPVGERVRVGPDENPWAEIVGIAGDIHQYGLDLQPVPQFYLPLAQQARGYMTLVVKSDLAPDQTLRVIKETIAGVDSTRALSKVATLEEWVAKSMAERRFLLSLIAGAAGVAVILALVGIYSSLNFHVARRTREIGIRVALGAARSSVVRLVGGRLAATGVIAIVFGLGLLSAAAPLVQASLFRVSAWEPDVLAAAAILLLAAAGLAGLAPIRRALRVDPAISLREE
ncbi:MAG: ABC transporter permease [Bryobacteraceae bacterium]|nr:ABC transporter permease [Bryobacteraceae bacterium]